MAISEIRFAPFLRDFLAYVDRDSPEEVFIVLGRVRPRTRGANRWKWLISEFGLGYVVSYVIGIISHEQIHLTLHALEGEDAHVDLDEIVVTEHRPGNPEFLRCGLAIEKDGRLLVPTIARL